MRGLICIPHTGTVSVQFMQAFMAMVKPEGTDVKYIESIIIHIAREHFADIAVREGYDWVFFLDSDMLPEPRALLKLLAHDKDIVSAPCFKRMPPHEVCFYKTLDIINEKVCLVGFDQWPTDLFEAEAVGAACLLIRTRALKQMDLPRFAPMYNTGEDIAFCIRAKREGLKIHVDPLVRCGHLSTQAVYEEHNKGWQRW